MAGRFKAKLADYQYRLKSAKNELAESIDGDTSSAVSSIIEICDTILDELGELDKRLTVVEKHIQTGGRIGSRGGQQYPRGD